jgi:hypothetical protein
LQSLYELDVLYAVGMMSFADGGKLLPATHGSRERKEDFAMSEQPRPKDPKSWQRTHAALGFLLMLGAAVIAYGVVRAWPLAQAKHQGALEVILITFCFSAFLIAGLGYGKRRLLLFGGIAWAVAFYLSSLFLDNLIVGNNAGTAIRVGALSALAFLLATSRVKKLGEFP